MKQRPAKHVILTDPNFLDLGQRIHALLTQSIEGEGWVEPFDLAPPIEVVQFANGEIMPRINETMRNRIVYYIADLFHPDVNTAIVRMLLTLNTLRYASVESVVLVAPYLPYERQDRLNEPRTPLSLRMIADCVEASKVVKHILRIDLHSDQLQNAFRMPVNNLLGQSVFLSLCRARLSQLWATASPDFGGAKRARRYARELGDDSNVVIFNKTRTGPNESEILTIIGEDVVDKDIILVDDLIDTAGSTLSSVRALRDKGAASVTMMATHGVFSLKDEQSAEDRLRASGAHVFTTESIWRDSDYLERNSDWLTIVPLDKLLAAAIREMATVGGSISQLFRS